METMLKASSGDDHCMELQNATAQLAGPICQGDGARDAVDKACRRSVSAGCDSDQPASADSIAAVTASIGCMPSMAITWPRLA